MQNRIARLAGAAMALLMAGTTAQAKPAASPASLWHGGLIITMDGDKPQTVQAVVTQLVERTGAKLRA